MPMLAAFMVPHPPLIVPEVGRGGERQIVRTRDAYLRAAREIAKLEPDTVIVSSPHAVMYADYFHISPGSGAQGSFAQFRAPQVRFREQYDEELVDKICGIAQKDGFPAGTLGERQKELDHGTMVPLYFIRQFWTGYKLVRIALSGLPLEDHYRLGQIVRQAAEEAGRRAVFVASGDLSHKLKEDGPYGFSPEGPRYDDRIMDVCARAAFGELFDFSEAFCEKAAECGHRSFVMMAGALDGTRVRAEAYSHEGVTGVGYGICAFRPEGADEGRRFLAQRERRLQEEGRQARGACDPWVRLAWEAVEAWVKERRRVRPGNDLPAEMLETRAGAFVSIHKMGRLRGCIGTTGPTAGNVAEEIAQNAVSACSRDPRFDPIRPEELPYLDISVDVLGRPEDIAGPEELDVKRYGVIVSKGMRRGLLLPDLDGVDSVEQQIAIAKQKAGIGKDERVSLQRFRVVRHT